MSEQFVDHYAERKRRNEASQAWATRSREEWTEDEDAFLISEWIHVDASDRDEVTVSRCLERTIEACRVRCEHLRVRLGIKACERPRKTTRQYLGVMDDPDDQWWSPDYYTTGG